MIAMIMEKRFEKVFLGSNAIVKGKMVSHHFGLIKIAER